MPKNPPPLPTVAAGLIRRQGGLITRAQLVSVGVPAWQIEGFLRRRQWLRLLPSVYLTSAGPPDDFQRIRAASLWAGPNAVVTGAAALYWQQRSQRELDVIDVATKVRLRAPASSPKIVAHRTRIDDFWRVSWNGIWVARTEYAIAELLATEGPALLDEAVRRRWVSVEMVAQVHMSLTHGRGFAKRAQILGAAEGGAISEAERVLHRHLRAGGITGWTANSPARPGTENRVGDAMFEEIKLLVEIDGFAFHTNHEAFIRDRVRQNEFALDGWMVLRFTWWQLIQDPDQVIREIREAIEMLSTRVARGRLS